MNLRTSILACALLIAQLATRSVVSAADAYNIDPTHCSIVFSVSHTGMSYVYGFFKQAQGDYILDKANPANCRFRLSIKADSLDTNSADRDKHLRGPDFFNVQQYQTITFDSTGCQLVNSPDGSVVYQVTGNLTIHGVTKPVTLALRMLGEGKGPFGDMRSGFFTQIELKRSDFEMRNLIDNNMVGDAVGITVSFEGSQQQPGAPPRQQ